jgi:hypothetical protein
MKVLELIFGGGLYLCEARHLTDAEKQNYSDEWKDKILIGTGVNIALDNLYQGAECVEKIVRENPYVGAFVGGSTQCYEVTQVEWESLLHLDQQAGVKKKIEELEDAAEGYRQIISVCEARPLCKSKEEAAQKARAWSNTQNEGGEGYVPHFYTIGEYEDAKRNLAAALAEIKRLEENT